MILNTIWKLNYGDDGSIVEQGDNIKIYLNNGEILIGEYYYSDFADLTIERCGESIIIDFKDIKDLEKL